MKQHFQFLFNTFCSVSLLVLLGITFVFINVFEGFIPISFVWYSLSVGGVSALLTLLFFTEAIIKSCGEPLRFFFFFLGLVGYVSFASHAFGIVNFSSPMQVIIMLGMIILIFAAVFCFNKLIFRQQEKEFASKLREYNESFDD